MALAEFVKFKHGLCKSCGVECFEGIVLEPCLLQPCFHVAGRTRPDWTGPDQTRETERQRDRETERYREVGKDIER